MQLQSILGTRSFPLLLSVLCFIPSLFTLVQHTTHTLNLRFPGHERMRVCVRALCTHACVCACVHAADTFVCVHACVCACVRACVRAGCNPFLLPMRASMCQEVCGCVVRRRTHTVHNPCHTFFCPLYISPCTSSLCVLPCHERGDATLTPTLLTYLISPTDEPVDDLCARIVHPSPICILAELYLRTRASVVARSTRSRWRYDYHGRRPCRGASCAAAVDASAAWMG